VGLSFLFGGGEGFFYSFFWEHGVEEKERERGKSSKRNQNPSRYYNSITNLKFQHKPKYHLSKILIEK